MIIVHIKENELNAKIKELSRTKIVSPRTGKVN